SAAAKIAHDAGAKFAVDSTVATPVLTRPIEHGADIVMHSATKYLNGHSDLVMGALVTRAEDEYWARLKMVRAQIGGIPGSFESWLLLRGMRTLFVRVAAACANAQAVAEHFANQPRIAAVLYPGLPDSPGHAVAKRQMTGGFGGMLSIRVKGGETAAIATAARVKVWKRATSLGGTESLIEHRASVEGRNSPCPPDLLRLSAGIENVSDLIADLEQALGGNS
ncbi:MAG TPA: PLP-dependent transferase, partial [Rhizomicrobium sp.]